MCKKERFGALFLLKGVGMLLSTRIRTAVRAALLHFLLSLPVALAVAWLVFGIWFPGVLRELTGGSALFLILMAVDLVCGPVLTLVLYSPAKSKYKWAVDLGLIVSIQMMALVYGMTQVASARPVFVAFEGDRFRVVQAIDINIDRLIEAPHELQSLSFSGPRIIGVHLAKSGDSDYLSSLQMSMQGLHPAFRPSRWRTYESQVPDVLAKLKPVGELRAKNPEKVEMLSVSLSKLGLSEEQIGYIPLVRDVANDWVVLVERSNGVPRAYLHLDGW